MKEFLRGDYWAALEYYEEAADLGVRAAQENAAYIFEKLLPTECAEYADYYVDDAQFTKSADQVQRELQASTASSTAQGTAAGTHAKSYRCTTAEECCKQYMTKLATRRWSQLAQTGEPRAMRKMADALLDPTQSFVAQNSSQAALLYALAGEQGDSESLLHLGWMLYYGEDGK